MKRSIPSRLCDRCGKVFVIADQSKARGHAFRAVLDWSPPPGSQSVPIQRTVQLGDLCPECAELTDRLLKELSPKEEATVLEGGTA